MSALVILAHPSLNDQSIANKIIVERIKQEDHVEIRNLYQMYPDFNIDVQAEQKALMEADTIVFQYPWYWYSIPGLLKEWIDRVFQYGFAYGSTGDKLHGKALQVSVTVGGSPDAYQTGGMHNHTVETFLRPLEQTAQLTGMVFKPPLVSHDMVYIPGVYNVKEDVEQRAALHAEQLVNLLN